MVEKYFLHRIQEQNGTYSKGIEIHDNLDSAVLSFWGRMKLAFGASNITFMSCKITDVSGNVIKPYDMTWQSENAGNKFFMHHIRMENDAFNKDIDVCETFDAARSAFATAIEYGYNNPKHPNVQYVSCVITDRSGTALDPFNETWIKPEVEPEPESEPEPEEQAEPVESESEQEQEQEPEQEPEGT